MLYSDTLDNIHGIARGGAVFSLINEAFEVSSSSHGNEGLALNMNMTYSKPSKKNSLLGGRVKRNRQGAKNGDAADHGGGQ